MPMNDGSMQSFALTLEKFLTHAAKWHSSAEVVTGREGGRVDRVSYAELERRSRKVSVVLDGMGIRQGDRVATLAWNTQAHVEAWYAIMGMGAICHTLNPRLTNAHLSAMLMQSQAKVLIASADLEPAARQLAEKSWSIARLIFIDAPDGHERDER